MIEDWHVMGSIVPIPILFFFIFFWGGLLLFRKKNSDRSHFYMKLLEDLSNCPLLLPVVLCKWADLMIPIEPPASYHDKIMSEISKKGTHNAVQVKVFIQEGYGWNAYYATMLYSHCCCFWLCEAQWYWESDNMICLCSLSLLQQHCWD